MPRYSLRTLFAGIVVVGVALAWIGWQIRMVSVRREMSDWLDNNHHGYVYWSGAIFSENSERLVEGDKSRRVSLFRRWLGDRDADIVLFYSADSPKRAVIEAFPEADIYCP
jgi:hypothetical protein